MTSSDTRIAGLEREVQVLNRLAEISVVLNSTLALKPLLADLLDAAAEITESEAASVLLWDENTRELRFAATTTQQSGLNLIGQTVPVQGSIAGTILTEQRIVQVDDTSSDPRHYSKVNEDTHFTTRSLLGVPMRSKDRVIGVLEALNKRSLPWTQADQEHLSVLAAQAAVAIESAQLVEALKQANQELSELDQLKNDFIAIASHELRTPLAVILGYASFLKDEARGQGMLSEHAEKVMASGLQLRRIIEDLMNLRYLQQNASELFLEPVAASDIIQSATEEVTAAAEARRQQITVAPIEAMPVQVDRIRATMALTNLLNNAVRFTPDGGRIRVWAEARAAEVWIIVEDTGIGIAEDQLDRIFDKFYQVENHMTRKNGGLGIGLSIARALAEAHGGRCWAASPGLEQGSTFTLALPACS
jgi:signal transduction histidine kinase